MAGRIFVIAACVTLSFSPWPVAEEPVGQAPAAQAPQHQHTAELGQVSFPVTCNAEAQTRMNRAVAMLHSFWFPEARKTFESVVQADPACGIAYWGVGADALRQSDGAAAAPRTDRRPAGTRRRRA